MYTVPVASYSAFLAGPYTALTGIQNISISRGRTYLQDPFPASNCVIELIPANSYATPLAIGQFIDVRTVNDPNGNAYFVGRITDVNRVYGMPFNNSNGAAPGDRIVITATGGTGNLGSNELTNYSWAESKAEGIIGSIGQISGTTVHNLFGSNVLASAQTYSGPALDAVNDLLRTGNLMMDDGDRKRGSGIGVYGQAVYVFPVGTNTNTIVLTDSGTGTKYNQIEFLSSNQTTFNKVTVSAAGLTPQVAETGSSFNNMSISSFNVNTAEALSLANYLLQMTSSQLTPVPFTVSTTTEIDANCLIPSYISGFPGPNTSPIGAPIQITFRGSTVTGIVQGVRLYFDIEQARIQYMISPSLGQPFVLNSTLFGVLNTNRLGYP